MGGSVRIGSRFHNCFRAIHMRRSWPLVWSVLGRRTAPRLPQWTDNGEVEQAKTKHLESAPTRVTLFDLPTDEAALLGHYTLSTTTSSMSGYSAGGAIGRASRSRFAPFDIRGGFRRWGRSFP